MKRRPAAALAAAGDEDRTVIFGEARAPSTPTIPAVTVAAGDGGLDGRYPGGKGQDGVHQWLIGLMPTHAFYCEPFAGKGALLRRKPPALRSLLLDLDPDVIAWWRRLGYPGTLARRGDGIHWLERHGRQLGADALVYCDPPYLMRTRTKKRIYRYELTDLQHRRLLRCLQEASCPVMLSGYGSKLYDGELRTWHREERQAMTRGGVRTEVCWCNYNPRALSPALATEYAQLGRDFRERERVSRKLKRWVSRLRAMPAEERRAILLACLDGSADLAGGGDARSTTVNGVVDPVRHRQGRR